MRGSLEFRKGATPPLPLPLPFPLSLPPLPAGHTWTRTLSRAPDAAGPEPYPELQMQLGMPGPELCRELRMQLGTHGPEHVPV